MDFGKLLSVAQRNAASSTSSEPKAESRYYPAKFAPPKKESKDKKLSANIQKFLAKREQEERQKEEEARRKREELNAKRDPKAKRKIEKMLKVIRSANKSGPEQPDEDDTVHVDVASAIYQQLMDKYKATPEEKKFKDGEKRTMSKEEMQKAKAPAKKKAKRPQGPPPPDFATLLKLAEQKQMEPVKLETPLDTLEKKKKEPERLMTKKEKKEYEERMAYLEEKKIRDRIRNDPKLSEKEKQIKLARYDAMKSGKAPPAPSATSTGAAKPVNVMAPNGRIPKLNSGTDKPAATVTSTSKPALKPPTSASSSKPEERRPSAPSKPVDPARSKLEAALTSKKPTSSTPSKPTPTPSSSAAKKPISSATSGKPSTSSSSSAKVAPPASNGQPKSRPFPPADVQRTRQFPPPDVQRKRPGPPPSSSSSQFKKRRPVIEDSDSEYDSEMDDFIDDEGAEEDISSHIRAIFGYDKSRYRDEDFDDRTMESNFAQVQREEYISKKIGLQEDLEDMRLEEEEKRQKALAKKKAAAAAKGSGGKRK
ncbi:latent nuclear antigen [Culex quinquefasciatus]|uniref:Protein SPT2 homolog n=1 Tax=Culex quinquefasciatus TaxID=7176 RepID=B0XB22_CULQU|nr:latent nuclear antigen [Culex quinquefasciatus]|eukprot:XP_001866844.1 latent nuclear antigen [Culex quinquefasciatus]